MRKRPQRRTCFGVTARLTAKNHQIKMAAAGLTPGSMAALAAALLAADGVHSLQAVLDTAAQPLAERLRLSTVTQKDVVTEALLDSYLSARRITTSAHKIGLFLDTHILILAGILESGEGLDFSTGGMSCPARLRTKIEAEALFDEKMTRLAAAPGEEPSAGSSSPTATFLPQELRDLTTHAKSTGVIALFDVYRHALLSARRIDAVTVKAIVETPANLPPLVEARRVE